MAAAGEAQCEAIHSKLGFEIREASKALGGEMVQGLVRIAHQHAAQVMACSGSDSHGMIR